MVSIWSNDHIDVWHVELLVRPWLRPYSPRCQQLICLHSWWVRHHIYSTQAAVPFVPAVSPTPQQHQLAGHTLPQPMQPPCATAAFAQPFSLQLNNNTSLWDTPSHNQCKHHLPPLRLHNLHPFTLSAHHITTQPCQVFSHLIMSCSWNCKRLQ